MNLSSAVGCASGQLHPKDTRDRRDLLGHDLTLFGHVRTPEWIWDEEEGGGGGGLLLRMRWCRCTSSSRGRCSPGTTGKSYTAVSSSGPSSRRYRQCQSLSPGVTQREKCAHTPLISCVLCRCESDNRPLKSTVVVFSTGRFYFFLAFSIVTGDRDAFIEEANQN